MIIWTIKLLSNLRKAIAGRNHPYQLAWAVSFGLVLGLVPHGNLIAVGWLLFVLSVNINHSMAVLTAIGSSFAATSLDPYSHRLGQWMLEHQEFREWLIQAWRLPLVPWTDLNNTIVLGSLAISLAAMLPVFLITYPVFRLLSQIAKPNPDGNTPNKAAQAVVMVDSSHATASSPHFNRVSTTGVSEVATDNPAVEQTPQQVAVETRIDVIRMADFRKDSNEVESLEAQEITETNEPMDEAFRYLLRQLRDSQQRKAA